MIKYIFLFSICLFAGSPKLDNIENFSIGGKSLYLTSTISEMNPGPSGEDVIWDFSDLKNLNDTMRQWIVSPDSTPFAEDFPNANIAEKNSDGSYVFMEKDETVNKVWGIVSAQNLKIKYSKPYTFIERPVEYGDRLEHSPKRSYTTYGSNYQGSGTSVTKVDAWGTLKLPNKTYKNVLRLKFEQSYEDKDAGGTNPTKTSTVSYAWFDADHHSALLKMDSTSIASPYFNDSFIGMQMLVEETKGED